MDRGNFFHAIYRIEKLLGRAFSELQPYPLYPLDEYFGGTVRRGPMRALDAIEERQNPPLQAPLRKIA
jgi:hypothetical protein